MVWTVQEVTDVVAPILSQKLLLEGQDATDMTTQLGFYFGKVGVVNESSLSTLYSRQPRISLLPSNLLI